MQNLEGKKVLLTGASGAIGGQIARTLYERGVELAISGTRMDALNTLARELGSRCHVIQCNLGQADEVNQLYEKAASG
jgi:3-oxoacyl-[acyl-carrier protein] reductase